MYYTMLEDLLGKEGLEGGVEVGGEAGVGAGGLQAGAFDGGEPAEAFFGGKEAYGAGMGEAMGYVDHRLCLAPEGFEGEFGAEGTDAVFIYCYGGSQPAAALAHHYEADVDEFFALRGGEVANHGVFI